MKNQQEHTSTNADINYAQFFTDPSSARQKHYELIRSIIVDKIPIPEASKKFGYKVNSTYTLLRDFKSGKLQLFPAIIKKPLKRRMSKSIQNKIIALRKSNLSTQDIAAKLKENDIQISARTIERVLKDAGFTKLKRRTNAELGIEKK
jgi:transposase